MENLILDFTGDTLTAVLMGDMDHHGVASVRTQIDDAMFRLMPKRFVSSFQALNLWTVPVLGLFSEDIRKPPTSA